MLSNYLLKLFLCSFLLTLVNVFNVKFCFCFVFQNNENRLELEGMLFTGRTVNEVAQWAKDG